jgi:hypothetical protein
MEKKKKKQIVEDTYFRINSEHKVFVEDNDRWVKVIDELANWESIRVYVAQQQIRYGDNLHLQEMYQYCNERIGELLQSCQKSEISEQVKGETLTNPYNKSQSNPNVSAVEKSVNSPLGNDKMSNPDICGQLRGGVSGNDTLKCKKCKHDVACKKTAKACHYFQRIDMRLNEV